MTVVHDRVMRLLDEVVDPCSVATGVPLSIVEMGMVAGVTIEGRRVVVQLRMTSPLCHQIPYFEIEIDRLVASLDDVDEVRVLHDHGENWLPESMLPDAVSRLARHRGTVELRLPARG